MGFDTESEGEVFPQLGIDDTGELFTGSSALVDAALGDWRAFGDDSDGHDATPDPAISLSGEAGNDASFLDDSRPTESRVKEQRLLLAGLAFSLLLHFSLGGVLVSFEPDEHETLIPDVVSIRLLPTNPLREEIPEPEETIVEELPVEEDAVAEPLEEVVELLAEEALPEPVEQTEPLPQEASETEIAQSEEAASETELPDTQPVDLPPVLVIPNTEIVTRSIQSLESDNTSRLWAYDCNAQQKESDLIRCDDQATPDYDRVRENSTYRNLNPVRALNRSQRTLPTVAENAGALAGRLQDVQIPEGLSDYLMEEVEAGITHNTNAGNRTLENIELMTDKSDAAKIARDVLGDPWIKTQSRNNAQRRVVPR